MIGKLALATLLAILSGLMAHADVNPTEPGPGDVFRAGQTCHASWIGDEESKTAWKDMDIALMTGSNYNMVYLMTVATEQDGSVTGKVEFPCPEVNPYSAIYFYQFSSPHSDGKAWTTRFTIASPSGDTVPPTNQTQPGSNEKIQWGTGSVENAPEAGPRPNVGAEASESQSVHLSSSSSASKSLSSSLSANSTTSTSNNSSTATSMSAHSTVVVTAIPITSDIPKSDSTANFAPAATAGGTSILQPSRNGVFLWLSTVMTAIASLSLIL